MEKNPHLSLTNDDVGSDEMSNAWCDNLTNIILADDADIEDIFVVMDGYHEGLFDRHEKETLMMMHKGKRIAWPKMLGDWITLVVDGDKKQIMCNCSRCNSHGKCEWVAAMEVIQFGNLPPTNCRVPNEAFGWVTKVARARDAMKTGYVECDNVSPGNSC